MNYTKIDKKWQKKWSETGIYTPKTFDNEPFYNLWMFPYPSGEGLHAGHAFSSTGSDIYGRFMRMNGHSVFQPIGYDSFGIHAENHAIKNHELPKEMLDRTTLNYEQQLRSLGHGYDWTRTVTTSDIEYYRWTQWLFVEMFKSGLAYRGKAAVNWCPSCKTVLADEQVMTPKQAGKVPEGYASEDDVPEGIMVCERCGTVVEQKELEQWFFRITDYAERLLANHEKINWSERVVTAQKNWIGKKEGINISYPIKGYDTTITCFTTRPDTNYGASFIVIAPEHELVAEIINSKFDTDAELIEDIRKYISEAESKSAEKRQEEGRRKTGVFTGLYAVNRLNGYEMPVYISDFVLTDVGTGAVVGVPGHDLRDFHFAKQFELPIFRVVAAGDESEITNEEQVQEDGRMVNSEFLNGMDTRDAVKKMMDYLEKKKWGERVVTYHLRDWLISRQRYWGPPIPMIYCERCAEEGKSWFTENTGQVSSPRSLEGSDEESEQPVAAETTPLTTLHSEQDDWEHAGWFPANDFPVELPEIEDYEPEGEGRGPLANHPDFYKTKCPHCGGDATRETDVSDTFLDSSWYFLRYPSVDAESADKVAFDTEITNHWLPVNLYFGGAEHAVLHLMYARFVTQVLHDRGYLDFEEPFPKFFAHGLMIKDGAKMSKSRGNVVNPDEYIAKYGADTLRLYLMFMGPMDGNPDFRDSGIEGMSRFLARTINLFNDKERRPKTDKEEASILHQTIKKVTDDIGRFHYNTAIATIMELVNFLRSKKSVSSESLTVLAQLLAPFAPHIAEEIWVEKLGHQYSVHCSAWPAFDVKFITEDTVTIAVQVNGKLRSQLTMDRMEADNKDRVVALAKEEENVGKWLTEGTVTKTIFVPGKLVNFVVE